jgi:AraC-like DNA-binding protein/quercetin dioxygenase-like cupin family protein
LKTVLQKIHLEQDRSFACRKYITPGFETNWHKHEEFELIIITHGHGIVMMGDFVGEYKTGDVFFIAGNLSHWFRKSAAKMVGGAIVTHFAKSFWGDDMLQLPEMKQIHQLLLKNNGIQLQAKLKKLVVEYVLQMEKSTGFESLHILLQCLQTISSSKQFTILTHDFASAEGNVNPAIEKIIDYSFKHYLEPITLQQVAGIAEMSIPTFCRFFKKNIKKTYFDFLQELRISHACKLLANTDKSVLEICYESGYNSWAHFSKQFKKVKEMTATQYRKQFIIEN